MRTVGLIELSVLERITPLASGYLQAYASIDPVVSTEYEFMSYTTSVKTSHAEIVSNVLSLNADVYGFSCYVWNMGLMRRVVKSVREAAPNAHIILGGPQVMHHAQAYIDATNEQVAICDGEGEATFAAYLRELTDSVPDLSRVAGLTFARDGEFVTTEQQKRFQDLNEIPSPYLAGLFTQEYTTGMLETNRGCPYHCGFCYWGAATNDRVYRFDEDRVRAEVEWMAHHNILLLWIADANWGMLPRDVELSQFIADCAREYKFPRSVYFSSAKNKPHAVTKIAEIFDEAGLVSTQPVSMQTLEPKSLEIITRSNIKLDAYSTIQQHLLEKKISSYVELIFPLPGETIHSFKAGVSELCERNAQTITVYPHLLLHNTPIYRNQVDLGLVTRPANDGVAEASIVVQTKDVSTTDFADGMRFFYATHALHNMGCLKAVGRYLSNEGVASHGELFSRFVDFWRSVDSGDPIVEFVEKSIEGARFYDLGNYGLFGHHVLHAHRRRFSQHLVDFMRSQEWWDDPIVRAMLEIDLLNRPYIYSNTPLEELWYPFESLRVVANEGRTITVELNSHQRCILPVVARTRADIPTDTSLYVLNHERKQYPYMSAQSLDHNSHYCHAMLEKVQSIMPSWSSAGNLIPGLQIGCPG